MRNSTVNNREADDALVEEFLDMLYEIGAYEEPDTTDNLLNMLYKLLGFVSVIMYAVFGIKSYYFK